MIDPQFFLYELKKRCITFFSGVPDSLLSDLCFCIEDNLDSDHHVIAANEGNAIAIASGYYLSTRNIPAVYMQNSGLGNAVNPLVSLNNAKVYEIPLLLIIGWRGEPDIEDEPQHIMQGEITLKQLKILKIPTYILSQDASTEFILNKAFADLKKLSTPVAILVRKGTFEKYISQNRTYSALNAMLREEVLEEILNLKNSDDVIVSTTGKTSRELYELRTKREENHTDFMNVGSMGHTSSLALGIAIAEKSRRIICIDGDGSMLMHLGSLATIGSLAKNNFFHILLNNYCHESVGGQPTSAKHINFGQMSKALGYKVYKKVLTLQGLKKAWKKIDFLSGPILLEIEIKNGSRSNLGRPKQTPKENKIKFMDFLNRGS